jgi:hypothetical protein
MDRRPDTATAWVYGAYVSLLDRLPDAAGLATHSALLRRGGSPTELVAALAASDEAADDQAGATADLDEIFVTGAYLVALGRQADTAGLQAHRDALRSGGDHEEVLESLLRSPEASNSPRFPPAAPSALDRLARSVQAAVAGTVDPEVHRALVRALRNGGGVVRAIQLTLRLRGGRRTLLLRLPALVRTSRRRAERGTASDAIEALESYAAWDWRVQQSLRDEVARLSTEVASLSRRGRRLSTEL